MNAEANSVVAFKGGGALTMSEGELVKVLQSSLYPSAALESIKMVLGYCKAAGYDPMQKPVHIVPMWDSKAGQMRDVIMPGVGLYRTQAARTGQFAGMTEPEFGPDVTEEIGGVRVTYPQWCRVTVKRLMPNGTIAEFTAREFWKENYAMRGGKDKSIAPNAMWGKRVYGQLAKCAGAQAMRIGFPEATGAAATAEEMEGKELHREVDVTPDKTPDKAEPIIEYWSADEFTNNFPAWTKLIVTGKKDADYMIDFICQRKQLTDEQKAQIRKVKSQVIDALATADQLQEIVERAGEATITMAEIGKRFNITNFDAIPAGLVPGILAFIADPVEA